MPVTEMKDHVYKFLELVGSSEKSIEDAIQNAIIRASKTIREMKWFEVAQTRGHIENGSVRHYQVTLRVRFTLVPQHSDYDWSISSQSRMGMSCGATRISMLRATPG